MSAYGKLMDEHLDLQVKYEKLLKRMEEVLEQAETPKPEFSFGAAFVFKDESVKKISIFQKVPDFESAGEKPTKCMVNFTTKMLTEWMDSCNDALEKKEEPVLIEDIQK